MLVCRTIATLIFASLVCFVFTTAGYGQLLGVYRFDAGGDGTSWDDAMNWQEVLDPFGVPVPPIFVDPPTPPGPTTSAEIPLPGVVIDNTMPGQTALDVRIGTADGAGSLTMSGGALTVRDFNIGADGPGANAGTFTHSGGILTAGDDVTVGAGSPGTLDMSGGSTDVNDDFNIATDGTMTMSGGTVTLGD